MKNWNKEEWKAYAERLREKAKSTPYGIEWINLMKRIKWIKENRIYGI